MIFGVFCLILLDLKHNKMYNYILFDDNRTELFPLTHTRPVGDLRIGILTIKEKWEKFTTTPISFLTEKYLSEKYPTKILDDNIFVNGSICPDMQLLEAINNLQNGQYLVKANIIIAARFNTSEALLFSNDIGKAQNNMQYNSDIFKINHLWDIFGLNGKAIAEDFELLTRNRKSAIISNTNQVASPENIFIEEGAKVEFSILNASTGFIYIGKDTEIMEGCVVRGPFALCDKASLKMASKIYGPTTIGPGSKVGGEINNSVLWGNSNKAHDGFLGNSVLGEWCNLGADTNNSNLKNNYSEVKLWNYSREKFISTGLTFCGLIMGDHSKCGINTMFNTGTVVGVSANIFGAGYPRNFIPCFSWGGPQGMSTYPLDKAIETAEKVMIRRNIEFSEVDKKIFEYIFVGTEKYRRF
jgi:UDP-N-acetylglucosamine diphosphorylase/glucosamine-1-phosphate N-acetyltransferase